MPCNTRGKKKTARGMLQEILINLKEGFEKKHRLRLPWSCAPGPWKKWQNRLQGPLFALPTAMGSWPGATALPKKGPVVIASYSGYPVTILYYGAGGSVKGLSRF